MNFDALRSFNYAEGLVLSCNSVLTKVHRNLASNWSTAKLIRRLLVRNTSSDSLSELPLNHRPYQTINNGH